MPVVMASSMVGPVTGVAWEEEVFEYEHQCQGTAESSKKQKLFLMSWCPDS